MAVTVEREQISLTVSSMPYRSPATLAIPTVRVDHISGGHVNFRTGAG